MPMLPKMRRWTSLRIYAVGHSTRPLEELVALLQAHGVLTLADVRTVPRSRTNPQFNREALAEVLPGYGLRYVHLAALGGLRRTIGDASPNRAWRNLSFRGYADYMQTRAFQHGLAQLREEASLGPLALMCAEALRWRCHRSLIADALYARGCVVEHLESMSRATPHRPPPFARISGSRVRYPEEAA